MMPRTLGAGRGPRAFKTGHGVQCTNQDTQNSEGLYKISQRTNYFFSHSHSTITHKLSIKTNHAVPQHLRARNGVQNDQRSMTSIFPLHSHSKKTETAFSAN